MEMDDLDAVSITALLHTLHFRVLYLLRLFTWIRRLNSTQTSQPLTEKLGFIRYQMSPTAISQTSRQDSSTTLHDAMDAEAIHDNDKKPALSRGNTANTKVDLACPSATPQPPHSSLSLSNCASCGALKHTRSLSDIAEAGTPCHRQCLDSTHNDSNIAVVNEKQLQVTDDERNKAPPFCEMQKVLSGKGVELIYVGWNGPDDPANPRNWSHKKKWIITAVGCLFCSIVSLSFSAYSIAINDIAERLDTSYLLSVAGVSLFTLTFGVAPLILAPLSEVSFRVIKLWRKHAD